jgi:hypothetical protein
MIFYENTKLNTDLTFQSIARIGISICTKIVVIMKNHNSLITNALH